MNDLIEALTIFSKYDDRDSVYCRHDVLCIFIDPKKLSIDDVVRLAELSFTPNNVGGFLSYRFGNC